MTYIFQAKDLFPASGTIKVSQGPHSQLDSGYFPNKTNATHVNYEAVDYSGAGWYKAPVAMTVKHVDTSNGRVVLQSNEKIQFANGQIDYLCLFLVHMNSVTLKANDPVAKGANIYKQGTAGDADGAHVHLSIGMGTFSGSFTMTKPIAGSVDQRTWATVYSSKGELKHSNAFYINDYKFTNVPTSGIYDNDVVGDGKDAQRRDRLRFKTYTPPSPTTGSGYALVTPNSTYGLRHTPAGALKMTLPKGGISEIIRFEPGFKGDGYQWAYVNFNGNIGYCQIDTKNFNYIQKGPNATKTLYFVTPDKKTAALRSAPVGGLITTIPANTRVPVLEIYPRFERDTYQWVRVKYGNTIGWSQIDTNGYNYLSF